MRRSRCVARKGAGGIEIPFLEKQTMRAARRQARNGTGATVAAAQGRPPAAMPWNVHIDTIDISISLKSIL